MYTKKEHVRIYSNTRGTKLCGILAHHFHQNNASPSSLIRLDGPGRSDAGDGGESSRALSAAMTEKRHVHILSELRP